MWKTLTDPTFAALTAIRHWSDKPSLVQFALERHGYYAGDGGFGITYPGDLDEYEREIEVRHIPDGFVLACGFGGPPEGHQDPVPEWLYRDVLAEVLECLGMSREASSVRVPEGRLGLRRTALCPVRLEKNVAIPGTSVLTTYCRYVYSSLSESIDLLARSAGMVLATVSHSQASGTKQPYGVRSHQLPLMRLSRRSATPQKPLRADTTVIQRRRLDPRRVTASRWRAGVGIETRPDHRPRRAAARGSTAASYPRDNVRDASGVRTAGFWRARRRSRIGVVRCSS